MKNKLLLSVVTSTLLTTSAFAVTPVGAGDLSITSGGGISTIEYDDKYGNTNALDFTTLEYTASIKGSGAVSDALVRINVSDTNLSSTIVPAPDLDAIFADQRIMNFETNETVAIYDKSIIDDAGETWVLFAGDSDQSIINGKDYRMRDDGNLTSGVTYEFNTGNEVQLDVWSTSGSEEIRDFTKTTTTSTLVPQFTTSCITKFDGLINIESLQDSFVNTNHDNASGATAGATDGLSQTDTFVFTVNNDQQGDFLEGNATAITMQTRNANGTVNVNNDFTAPGIWTASATAILPNGQPVTYTLPPETANVSTADLLNNTAAITPALTATAGVVHYTLDGNLTFILPNTTILDGTTTYYVNLTHTSNGGAIRPVEFVNGRLALEAGLTDNNESIYPAGNADRTASQDAGAWMNHAYIAQISGTVAHADLLNKFYITNRSCSDATPQFNLILDGEVTPVTDVASKSGKVTIIPDSQEVYTLEAIIAKAGTAATGKYAVEIILPGVAENFYIYAQSKNTDINQFKDLPVYSTSERD